MAIVGMTLVLAGIAMVILPGPAGAVAASLMCAKPGDDRLPAG